MSAEREALEKATGLGDTGDLKRRFGYHKPKDEQTVHDHEMIRDTMHRAAIVVSVAVPAGREQSLAITKLEEAMFWANAAIARAGADQ